MKKIGLSLYLILFCCYMYATPQAPDILIYKGDTIAVYPFLLEQYIYNSPDKDFINSQISDFKETSTACWRGFTTLLEVKNDSLFIVKAYGKEDIDLLIIFGKRTNIFAGWYSGILTNPKNLLISEHAGWGGFYEYETDFKFENGILKDVQIYHNEIKPSIYTNSDTLMNFIKTNIIYDNVKPVKGKIRVQLTIEDVDNSGRITKVSVLRGYDGYNEEAIRVIKSIPQWEVIIRRGKKMRRPWSVPVYFVEQ